MADPHALHDLEVVASLLDGDLPPADRAVAARQVAGCAACADLHQGLLALSVATRALPTPARPRDFRITAADAARLREPVIVAARLTSDMHDPTDTRGHTAHDTILVASLADRTLPATERERVERSVSSCRLCASLFADLVAIREATIAMPTPPRPTDYRLTPNDAIRLRPTGWRRLVTVFGSSRDVFSRPLAVGLTTLGLAGLLVATVPSVMPLGSSTAGQGTPQIMADRGGTAEAATDATATDDKDVQAGGAEAVDAGPESAPGAAAAAPTKAAARPVASTDALLGQNEGSTGAQSSGTSNGRTGSVATTVADDSTGLSALVILSGTLLIIGLGLFAMRWSSRRFGD